MFAKSKSIRTNTGDPYSGYYGNPNIASSRTNVSYSRFYPLNATSLNDSLRFGTYDPTILNGLVEVPISVDGDPNKAALYFNGYSPFGNQSYPAQIQNPGGPSPTNFPGQNLTMAGDAKTLYSNISDPNNSDFFNSRLAPPVSWTPNTPYPPQNLRMQSNYSDTLICNDIYGDGTGAYLYKTSEENQKLPQCRWRTFNEAFGCCTSTKQEASQDGKCGPAFMPNAGINEPVSLCPNLMVNACQEYWGKGGSCDTYLQEFTNTSDAKKVIQTTVRDYINSQAQRTGCGTNDYTTPRSPGGTCVNTDGKQRDDSKDQFLSTTLPFLCKSSPGACDLILNEYCAQFTREDLENLDTNGTIQQICGCHLSGVGGSADQGGLTDISHVVQPNQYPYPGITTACDPICAFAGTIPYSTETCSSTVCILDDININQINSQGSITINQICGGTGSNAKSSCYISGLDINEINSQGKDFLNQNCTACYAFCPSDQWHQNRPANAVQVPCGNPLQNYNYGKSCGSGGTGGSSGSGSGLGKWISTHPDTSLFGGIAILCVIVVLITFLVIYLRSKTEF